MSEYVNTGSIATAIATAIEVDIAKPKRGRPFGSSGVRYQSAADAAGHTGILKTHIIKAINMGAPGVRHNRINWDVFGPWYAQNQKDIEAGKVTDDKELKAYKIIRELIDYDLDIAKKRKEVLSPEDVEKFLSKIGQLQTNLIKSWRKELPSKLAGKSETECGIVIETEANNLLNLYNSELKKWTEKS